MSAGGGRSPYFLRSRARLNFGQAVEQPPLPARRGARRAQARRTNTFEPAAPRSPFVLNRDSGKQEELGGAEVGSFPATTSGLGQTDPDLADADGGWTLGQAGDLHVLSIAVPSAEIAAPMEGEHTYTRVSRFSGRPGTLTLRDFKVYYGTVVSEMRLKHGVNVTMHYAFEQLARWLAEEALNVTSDCTVSSYLRRKVTCGIQ